MKRALILLLIFGIVMLGCAEKKPITQKLTEKPAETPTKRAPTPTETPTPAEDINKTLTDVNELLKELQDIENVSFNL